MRETIFHALARAAREGKPVALGILTGVKGSSPQKLGAKAVFHPDRTIQGTLGGGCLEAEVQRLALQSLRDGQAREFELVLDHDFGWDDGLICGGKVAGLVLPNAQAVGEDFWSELAARRTPQAWGITRQFKIVRENPIPPVLESNDSSESNWRYQESVKPRCALWIAGSGHLAQAVAPLAFQLDFAVRIFDDRPELANHDIFPRETALSVGDWGEILVTSFPNEPVFGLIVTRGHKHDALVLESWIHHPFAFLGMIGSERKARTLREHFQKHGLATAEEIARLVCPVGIRIRSNTAAEIAVDILAQYIDRRAAVLSPECATRQGT